MRRLFYAFLALAIILPAPAEAIAPSIFIYGGRLSDSGGTAIPGPVDIRLTFYEESTGGSIIGIPGNPNDRIDFGNVALVDGVFDLNLDLNITELEGVFGGSTDVFIHLEYCDQANTCTPYPDNGWVTSLDRQQFTFAPYCLKVPVDPTNLGWTSTGNLIVTNLGNIASQDSSSVSLTGGSISGLTSLAVDGAILVKNPAYSGGNTGVEIFHNASGSNDFGFGFKRNGVNILGLDSDGTTQTTISSQTGDLNLFASGGVGITVEDSTGKVGIGTTSPDGTLHVHTATAGSVTANTSLDDLVVENSDHAGITILTPNNKTAYYGFGDSDDSHTSSVYYDHSLDAMYFYVNNDARMTIESNGEVGIGTTTPSDLLHVNSTSTSAFVRIQSASGNNDAGIKFYHDSTNVWNIRNNGNNDSLYIIPAGNADVNTVLAINSNGNVGIGTTNPQALLTLNGGSNANNGQIRMDSGGNFSGISFYNLSTGDTVNSRNWQMASNWISFGHFTILRSETYNGNPRTHALDINKDGDVGIGTTTPESKLEVNGAISTGNGGIRWKTYVGTLTSPGSTFFLHGVDKTKVVSLQCVIEHSSGSYWPISHDRYNEAGTAAAGDDLFRTVSIGNTQIEILLDHAAWNGRQYRCLATYID